MSDTAENLIRYQEEAANKPLLYKGWLCALSSVDKIWFTGSMSQKPDSEAILHLHILFHDMRRADFSKGTEDELIAQAEEYLQSIKDEERKYQRPRCEKCVISGYIL